MLDIAFKRLHIVIKERRENFFTFVFNTFRNWIDAGCYRASDTCHRICIATERNSEPYNVLEVLSFEKADDCLRHGTLTRYISLIARAYFIDIPHKFIMEFLRYVITDFIFRISVLCHPYCRGYSLRSLDTFGMIMRDFG